MKPNKPDWYKSIWNLEIKNQSWVENTKNEVDFIVKALNLTGKERILDLACGFGRHSLEFSRRGYDVTGVDITEAYIDDAKKSAYDENLNADFLCSDIRDVSFENEFDVVLNLADGAIGYLENDEENLRIFDVISKALKSGGKHFMDICNGEHAEHFFPKTSWEAGEKSLSLASFEWDSEKKIMLFGGCEVEYGEIALKPEIPFGDPTRLYTVAEIENILSERGMLIKNTFSDYYGTPASYKNLQLMILSEKL